MRLAGASRRLVRLVLDRTAPLRSPGLPALSLAIALGCSGRIEPAVPVSSAPEVSHVDRIVKVPTAFPSFSAELAVSMRREMHDMVRDVALGRPRDLLSLLTVRDTHVDGALAELYGLPAPPTADSWVPVTLPEDGPRAGLLGLAGFLALHAAPAETSATKRGFFVVSKLLCRTVPPPPPDVEANLPEPAGGENVTMRERVERHMSEDRCRGCHGLMDPPGLALEHFDGLGAFRETDDGPRHPRSTTSPS